MEIVWKERKIEEWREYLSRLPRSNYLQSIPFARAVLAEEKKQTRIGVIVENGRELGLASIQELRFGPLHIVSLYRGPLWFDPDPPARHLEDFARLFNALYPKRLFRIRRWLPEWSDSSTARALLHELGFRCKGQDYETIFLDLRPSLEDLLSGMRSSWRQSLQRGEKMGVRVNEDWTGSTAKLFVHRYDQDRQSKGYKGRSKAFVRMEMSTALAYRDMFLLWAIHEGKSVAAIMILIHGKSASYRIGFTSPEGRSCNAHHVLLWHAIKLLKEKGVMQLDLAGVEPTGKGGLSRFKSGLGGSPFRTVGLLS